MKIILIGSGNVATHFGKALKSAGHSILQVYSRGEAGAKTLAKKLSCKYTTGIKNISGDADVYIIAIRDEAIENFIKSFHDNGKIVLHTSGSVSLKVLKKKFRNCGVLYPVQTFSISRKVNFNNIPLCIEGCSLPVKKKIKLLAGSLSGKIHFIDSEQRKKIHLSAVFANNFANHLFAIAEHILAREKISFDILKPLILETAMKVQHHLPGEMQTGPAKRGDRKVIEDHIKHLADRKQFREIYKLISESISEMSGVRL